MSRFLMLAFTLKLKVSSDSHRESRLEGLLDRPHDEIMATLAGRADPVSQRETYCHAATEALAHGVPVMAAEVPPALKNFLELTIAWGAEYTTTSLQDRRDIQKFVHTEYSMGAFGTRLERTLLGARGTIAHG